jgi:hypothetical protein
MTDISTVPVELWNIGDISPYEFNNKKHPEKHIEMLMRSIKAQGHLDPIVVDLDGVIISGHGRHEALKRLGKVKVAVRCLRDVTEAQASALRIAANKTVSNEYDTDMLSRELSRLNDMDMDLGALGFDEKELSMLMTDVGLMDDDSLVIDMDDAVTKHEQDVDDQAAAADGEDVRLDKAFGFKVVPLRDQRVITRFMAEIEAKSGLTGSEALVSYMSDCLAVTV